MEADGLIEIPSICTENPSIILLDGALKMITWVLLELIFISFSKLADTFVPNTVMSRSASELDRSSAN